MYTVSKCPSKLVAKTRRGVSQNFERLENSRESTKKTVDVENNETTASASKPIFHISKRSVHNHREPDVISPQHEELIKYIQESWNSVHLQYHRRYSGSQEATNGNTQTVMYYEDGERSAKLKDFKPFDLESWWGKRIFNSITKSL